MKTKDAASGPARPRVYFGELPIGARFHVGKWYGMGARSHVLNWHEMVKESKQGARIVESHGDIYRTGTMSTPGRLARVFPII